MDNKESHKHRYFIVYKPFRMVSQFVSPYDQRKLCDLDFEFPEGTQAVGRLDNESEGLLILTTDKTLTRRLLDPEKKHERNYIVQVERLIEDSTINKLCSGIDILLKGKNKSYTTLPCGVKRIDKPQNLAEREELFNEKLPHSWLEFALTEGKNRQIRKMCRSVRHKCRRLIRTKIEDLELGNLQPGEVMEMEQTKLFNLLRLE